MRGVYSVLRVPCFDGAVRISRNPLQSGDAMERAVLPWVLLYAGLCPAPLIFLFDLQSAYKETAFGLWGFVFIRELRCSLVVSFGFFHEEYLIALVDFIVALRRTKGRGRRTLRSPPSPSSGLHLIHPGCPLRRGISAAAGLGAM